MGIFGKIIKGTLQRAALPIDIIKDVATLGGAITDEESAVVKKFKKLNDTGNGIMDELEDL